MSYWCNYHYPAGQSVASDFDRQRNNRSPRSGGVRDHNFLQSLIGKNVKINRGGPDSIQGKLLAVKSDFLVLSTNEGVVYVASSHVKSITEMERQQKATATKPDAVIQTLSTLTTLPESFARLINNSCKLTGADQRRSKASLHK